MHNNVEITHALELCIEELCEECNYKNGDIPSDCMDLLMRDALALIKPRILTWDEAVLDEGRDVVYIEKKGDCIPEPGIVIIGGDKFAGFLSPLGDEEGYLGIQRDWLGIDYRFWSCRPSKKQIEDTPWKEQMEEVKNANNKL